jgi:hypothetical protein
MSSTPKALAHGMLIAIEITVVVFFVASLAVIAVVSSFGTRKRNRYFENLRILSLTGAR